MTLKQEIKERIQTVEAIINRINILIDAEENSLLKNSGGQSTTITLGQLIAVSDRYKKELGMLIDLNKAKSINELPKPRLV